MNETEKLIKAIATTYEKLPDLIDGDWEQFEVELTALLRRLDSNQEDADKLRENILELFQQHPRAKQLLTQALEKLTPIRMRGFSTPVVSQEPAGSEILGRYTSVPVYFGTDRMPTDDPDNAFSGQRGSGELSLGVAKVSIPDDHRMGTLEKPKRWKLQFRLDPEQHVVLLGVDHLDHDAFIDKARKDLAGANINEALVFIHGYNVAFNDAIERTAQVSYDLNFSGLTMAYSWPSEGDTKKYTIDEANIAWSRPHLETFLRMAMSELGVDTVSVIAHSMGNRALTEIIPKIDQSELPPGSARLREVIFAAPDVDAGTFTQLAAEFHGRADRFTLYASSNDKALLLSKLVHKYSRAGDAGNDLVVTDDVDTVDASELDTGLLGHAYYGDNRSVLSDIFLLVNQGLDPVQRNLRKQAKNGKDYWLFKP
jgi:esterase/lipase superfamily enzyme